MGFLDKFFNKTQKKDLNKLKGIVVDVLKIPGASSMFTKYSLLTPDGDLKPEISLNDITPNNNSSQQPTTVLSLETVENQLAKKLTIDFSGENLILTLNATKENLSITYTKVFDKEKKVEMEQTILRTQNGDTITQQSSRDRSQFEIVHVQRICNGSTTIKTDYDLSQAQADLSSLDGCYEPNLPTHAPNMNSSWESIAQKVKSSSNAIGLCAYIGRTSYDPEMTAERMDTLLHEEGLYRRKKQADFNKYGTTNSILITAAELAASSPSQRVDCFGYNTVKSPKENEIDKKRAQEKQRSQQEFDKYLRDTYGMLD